MSPLPQHGLPMTLSVGEVARRSGVAVSALHFYEAKGLIRSERTVGNQRRYARAVLRRVSFIRVAQRPAGGTGPGFRQRGVRNWTNAWRS